MSELDVGTGIGESRVRRALFCPSKSPRFFRMLAGRCPVLRFVDRRAVVTTAIVNLYCGFPAPRAGVVRNLSHPRNLSDLDIVNE